MALLFNLISIVQTNWLVERLLLVSVELFILSILVWSLIRLLRIRSERFCSILWMLVLAKALCGFLLGAPLTLFDVPIDPVALAAASGQVAPASALSKLPPRMLPHDARAAEADIEPESMAQMLLHTRRYVIVTASLVAAMLAAIWAIGVAAMVFITGRDMTVIRKLYQAAAPPAKPIAREFTAMAIRLRIARPPRLFVSDRIVTPALVGWFRPVVLLPSWVAEEMTPEQLRWLLGHELMHWRHLDSIGLALRRVAQILFWFHPAVWIAGKRWEESMERACDRALIADMAEARDYAKQLYHVLDKMTRRKGGPAFSTGLFVTRTQVGRRIELLLSNPLAMPARLGFISIFVLLSLSAAVLPAGIVLVEPEQPAPVAEEPLSTASDYNDSQGEMPAEVIQVPRGQDDWLKVDFGVPRQPLQPGWTEWSAVYRRELINAHFEQAFSTPFDAYLEVEVSRDIQWRRLMRDTAGIDHGDLFGDGIRSFGEIRFVLRDLDEGDYMLAPVSAALFKRPDLPVVYDIALNGNVLMRDVPMAYLENLDAAYAPPARFTVVYRPGERTSETVVALRPHNGPLWINGFMLRRVGESFGASVSDIRTANGKFYSLATAATGERAYIDREYTLVSLPPELDQKVLLQTSNDDKIFEGDDLLQLDLTRPAKVYLCYPPELEALPAWASGFRTTEQQLVTTDRIYQIAEQDFPAGRVQLGGLQAAGDSSPCQYIIVIAPQELPGY